MSAGLGYASGEAPTLAGRLRDRPEDFQVVEDLGFTPDGTGEHSFVRVRKRGANTDWVARQLAAFAHVPASAVSYAGLKDRHALTEQWFSVHLPGRPEPDWPACRHADFQVLESHRNSRKLRRGALKGNAFLIVIRGLRGDCAELKQHFERLATRGVPNYFGEQRFGRDGANLARAEAMLTGRSRVRDRHKRGLYLSAARSHLFNQLLSERVAQGNWNRALPGEVLMLEASHSVFRPDDQDETIVSRIAALDLHPTGPLWGGGELLCAGEALVLERRLAISSPALCRGLEKAGLRQERRALRVKLYEAEFERMDAQDCKIRFWLPAGAYATSVLRELIVEG